MQTQSYCPPVAEKPQPQRPEILIRRAETSDDGALAALMGQLGYPTCVAEMAARLDLLLSRSEDYLVAVALRQGDVVGVIAAALGVYIERSGTYGRITALSVDAQNRNHGVGARLLAHAEAWLRTRGAVACIVNSQARRANAHRFYEREGYEVTGLRFQKNL